MKVLLIFGFLFGASFFANAWWDDGHRKVCELALENISSKKREEIENLIGRDSNWCFWADTIKRKRPETRPWHYINLARDDFTYSTTDCPEQGCIVSALEEQIKIYKDKNNQKWRRAEALKFIGHLVGDIHQPLHVGDVGHYGGNRQFITLHDGTKTNIHELWDGIIPAYALQLDFKTINIDLYSPQESQLPHEERIRFWIQESRKKLYDPSFGYRNEDMVFDQDYMIENISVVYLQIILASARLQRLLEEI